MREGTIALLQLAGPLLRLQWISIYQKWIYWPDESTLSFSVEINEAGQTEIEMNPHGCFSWLPERSRFINTLKVELDLRLESRVVKELDFKDLEMIVATANDYHIYQPLTLCDDWPEDDLLP